jgi:hypothetical protein
MKSIITNINSKSKLNIIKLNNKHFLKFNLNFQKIIKFNLININKNKNNQNLLSKEKNSKILSKYINKK